MNDTAPKKNNAVSTEDVLDFLSENQNFLITHPEIFDSLKLPPSAQGKNVKDFQSFLIERLKDDKNKIAETTQEIVENARSNMNNQQRIHAATLRLLEAKNFDEFIQSITIDLSSLLNTDISVLVVESDGENIPHIHTNGIRIVPEGTIEKWMGGQDILLQSNIGGIEAIYGGGANLVCSQALLRVDISMDMPPAMIAFGARDPEMFQDGQGTDLIAFLTRVIERCFRTWLNHPQNL